MDQNQGSGAAGLTAIPERALLLHIGVFKTGTTALQDTLRHAGDDLAAAGVLFRGPVSWGWVPLRKLMAGNSDVWQSMRQDLQDHPGRTMVSSENLCGSSDDEAREVVTTLGGERPVHVMITVRSLAQLLPSTWQQFLKRGMAQPFEEWLHEVLAEGDATETTFWRRNNFPRLVERWGALVGPENITVVVSDKAEPNRILRVTEALLAIPGNTLAFAADTRTNRSLSFSEAELLRLVNGAVGEPLPEAVYHRLVRLGVFPAIYRSPSAGDAIPVPGWAAEQVAGIGQTQAALLRASGARIVGDIDAISAVPPGAPDEVVPPDSVAMATAAAAVTGALLAANKQLAAPPAAESADRARPRWRRLGR